MRRSYVAQPVIPGAGSNGGAVEVTVQDFGYRAPWETLERNLRKKNCMGGPRIDIKAYDNVHLMKRFKKRLDYRLSS